MSGGDRLTISRKGLGSIAAALVVFGVLAVAPAFACTGNRGTINTSPARAESGAAFSLDGSGFQGGPEAQPVNIRWGGASGQLLAQIAPEEGGTFSTRLAVPAGAQPGWHQITATQRQAGTDTFFTANFAFEVEGVTPPPPPAPTQPSAPAPTPSPQASQPTQVSSTPQAAPTAQAAPAQTATARQPVTARATTPAAPPPAPPVAAVPLPVTPEAAPATPAQPPLDLSEIRTTDPAGLGTVDAEPVPALVVSDPAAMGGPRTIDSGAPLWMLVPLAMVGLTLFAASCAVVVSEMRQRRVKAKVSA